MTLVKRFCQRKEIFQKMLNQVEEFTHLVSGQWSVDKTNDLVISLLHNYKIKENDLQGNTEEKSSRFQLVTNFLLEY